MLQDKLDVSWAALPLGNTDMMRMNPGYFFHLGIVLNPLQSMKYADQMGDVLLDLYVAHEELERLLFGDFYQFRTCMDAGHRLHKQLQEAIDRFSAEKTGQLGDAAYGITSAAKVFQTILAAEMQTLDTYHASQKALYSTRHLIEQAEVVLPEAIRNTVPPETINEIRQAGRCLAFELPTACGFHIVRATEAVIREYYRSVVGTLPKLKSRNWGSYIRLLKPRGADAKIITVLEQMKDTYRNPIIHPEDVLEMEDAIILFGMAQGVIVSMMKDIGTRKAAKAKTLVAVPATT